MWLGSVMVVHLTCNQQIASLTPSLCCWVCSWM